MTANAIGRQKAWLFLILPGISQMDDAPAAQIHWMLVWMRCRRIAEIVAQTFGVIYILISRETPEHRLPQRMATVPAGACVSERAARHDTEAWASLSSR